MSRRPSTWVKNAILALGVALFALLAFGPEMIAVRPPAPSTQDAPGTAPPPPESAGSTDARAGMAPQRSLAVFVLAVTLWLTNMIPPPATGLLVVGLIPLLGIIEAKTTFSYFGNEAVFFILGVFLLAAAMIRTGLSGRLTLLFLQRFDRRPTTLITGIVVSAAFLALWMPEHAVTAMMFPIVLEIAQALNLAKGKSPFAKMMFLGLAWGSVVGGIGTFLGGARAPLALGLLRDYDPTIRISFLGWMVASMPLVVALTVLVVFVLRWRLRPELSEIRQATQMLDARVRELGPMTQHERKLAVVGLLTVAAWITVGHRFDLAVIAIAGASLLFILRIVNWREIEEYVNWGVLLMYGGAIALGRTLHDTHIFHQIVTDVLPAGAHPMVPLTIMVLGALALTEGISNAAAVAILLPIGFAICDATGISPRTMTLVVTIPAGLAFMLPISSPPNAMCYSAGYYSVREAVSVGIVITLCALVLTLACVWLYWPLVGYGYSGG